MEFNSGFKGLRVAGAVTLPLLCAQEETCLFLTSWADIREVN